MHCSMCALLMDLNFLMRFSSVYIFIIDEYLHSCSLDIRKKKEQALESWMVKG